MSRRNPSSRSASSPKVEEKVCISFSSCSTPSRGLSRSNRHLKFTSFAKDLHQVLKPEKMALGMPLTSLNAASNITHSAIASQDSSRMTTTFNAHCTGHCTVEDFNVNFANHDAKSVRYRTVRMISRAGAQRQLRTGAAVRTSVRISRTRPLPYAAQAYIPVQALFFSLLFRGPSDQHTSPSARSRVLLLISSKLVLLKNLVTNLQ